MEISKETMYKGVAAGAVLTGALGYAAFEAQPVLGWVDEANVSTSCHPGEGNGQAIEHVRYTNREPVDSGREINIEILVDDTPLSRVDAIKPVGPDFKGDEVKDDKEYASAPVGLKKLVIKKTWTDQKRFGNQVETKTLDLQPVEACPPETPPTTKPPVTTPPETNPPVVKRPPVDNGGVITPTTQPEAELTPPTPAVGIDTAISETAPALANTGAPSRWPEVAAIGGGLLVMGASVEMANREWKRLVEMPVKRNNHRFGRH